MTEQLPPPALDEPRGDMGDQAARLQMAEEQAAIQAALAGDVRGTDAYEDRGPVIDVLEGPELLDGEEVDASDDPVYGGGMPVSDPEEAALLMAGDDALDGQLAMTGFAEDGAAVAIDEGGTLVDDSDAGTNGDGLGGVDDRVGSALAGTELDDELPLLEELPPVDDETAAEDLDALIDVLDLGHDPDDPQDPDGYGVPPAPDGGAAVVDQAALRDPVDDGQAGEDA
ncbi:MAG TPA: hypothetical protein VF143_01315 [Candidatus Nanopelagicales bacterium]